MAWCLVCWSSLSTLHLFIICHFLVNIGIFFPSDLPYDVFLLFNDDNDTDRKFALEVVYPYLKEKCHYRVYRAEYDFPIPSGKNTCTYILYYYCGTNSLSNANIYEL